MSEQRPEWATWEPSWSRDAAPLVTTRELAAEGFRVLGPNRWERARRCASALEDDGTGQPVRNPAAVKDLIEFVAQLACGAYPYDVGHRARGLLAALREAPKEGS